jgi:hypothetical protein
VRSRGVLACLALAAGVLSAAPTAAPAAPAVTSPTLTSPPAGIHGFPLWDSYYDLAPFGYEEEEYFVSGTAVAAAGTPAAYTTRIIVTRPVDPDAFNGTVLLDWVNVTAQFENAVDTMLAREMLMREGYVYVHVSVQAAGVCCTPLTPKVWDPVRYAALNHPGDAWAFDILTQVAQAFRAPAPSPSLDPMGALGAGSVEHILAAGQSQSAIRLHEYLDRWLPTHPESVGVIDGVLVHGNINQAKPFAQPLAIPVLNLLSDAEAVDDGIDPAMVDPNYRLWEVAGTAHSDLFIGWQSEAGNGPRVLAGAAKVDEARYREIIRQAGNYGEQVDPLLAVCTAAGATMPMHYAASTAIQRLDRWVATGKAPPNGPRFEFADGQRAVDQYGNTRGGIRLPPIDVPVASYRSTDCQLGGTTVPFTDVQIQTLYGSHAAYYAQMAEKTDAAVAGGWLLPEDAVDLMSRVCAASNRFQLTPATCPTYKPPKFDHALPPEKGRGRN